MKKLSLVIAALAMMLGITQCKKQENPVGGKLITQEVTFTTSFGDGSKLDVDEEGGGLDLSWQVGDIITVSDGGWTEPSSTLECTSVSEGGKTGTFKGTIICIENAQLTFTVGTEPDYKNQHFTAINESEIYLVGESEFQQSGNYEVDMALPYAILKVDLEDLAPESDPTDVSVKIGGIEGNEVAKVTEVSAEEHRFYLLLPLTVTEPTETTLTFTAGDKTITRTYKLAPNGFYTGGGNGGYAPIMPDYLCFTAKEDGATVQLLERTPEEPGEKMNEEYFTPELEYSSDRFVWYGYSLGQSIFLNEVGSKVYFRKKAEAGTSSTFSISTDYYMYFVTNKQIAASGNIMSLLDPECSATKIPCDYCFYNLFHDCKSLITAPELPATTLASNCYSNMFNGCSSLNYIKVHFTSWDSEATNFWVSGVPAGGKFYCPKDLDQMNWGASGIPNDWEVKTF